LIAEEKKGTIMRRRVSSKVSSLEKRLQGYYQVARRKKCQGIWCKKEWRLDLCLEDLLVKGLGFGIDQ